MLKDNVRVVVFNACRSEAQAKASDSGDTIPIFEEFGVPGIPSPNPGEPGIQSIWCPRNPMESDPDLSVPELVP